LKAVLRSWGLFVLVGSLLLIPQMALLHALSHARGLAPPISYETQQDTQQERHLRGDRLCAGCLVFAQLGAALPARFQWAAAADVQPIHRATPVRQVALQPALSFRARAPPVPLI
jgi:hypothetical protein